MRLLWILLLSLALSGCDWMGRQADSLGEYMPVIGDRCEHWQCVTPEGQAESDAIKAGQQHQQTPQSAPQQNQSPPLSDMTPIYPPDPASPPPGETSSAPGRKQFPLNADQSAAPDNTAPH